MRIQHNVMAMNAYRNYNNNTSALSKNLEKLSSGYKINRAGDDAAGLAISEKMRAQITGLNAAQKNVKDGISLVKTAEGAMQEIQDMLNRMDYLATQSANGTYDNEVDRYNLQKEVNQLKDEINRIADSANFNGIKLLDGSLDAGSTNKMTGISGTGTTDGVFSIVGDGQLGVDPVKGEFTYDLSQLEVTVNVDAQGNITVGNGRAAGANYGIALAADTGSTSGTGSTPAGSTPAGSTPAGSTPAGSTPGTGSTPAGSTPGTGSTPAGSTPAGSTPAGSTPAGSTPAGSTPAAGPGKLSLTVSGMNVNIDLTAALKKAGLLDDSGNYTAGTVKITGADIAGDIATQINTQLQAKYSAASSTPAGSTPAGSTPAGSTPAGSTPGTGSTPAGSTPGTGSTPAGSTPAGSTPAGSTPSGASYVPANGQIPAYDPGTIGYDLPVTDPDAGIATLAAGDPTLAFLDADGKLAGAEVTVTADGSTLKISMKTAPTSWDKNTAPDMTLRFSDGSNYNGGEQFAPTVVVEPVDSSRGQQYAQAKVDLNAMGISDGSSLKLGDTTYTFAVGADSKYKGAAGVVDMTDVATKDAGELARIAADRLTKAAAGNKTFIVGSTAKGVVSLTEKKDGVDYKVNNLAGKDGKGTQGTNATNNGTSTTPKVDSDLNGWAGLVSYSKGSAATGGKALTLQIGDTSDSFNQMSVSIGDMHTTGMGIEAVDVSTQDGAAAAVQTIKDAINYVSGIRGDLGAIQNRLEHTQNNLSVMAENIQDAESTIRDTDVAEEMMSYVKNNILVQSAQAMLAQANQVPQGVLQLLG